MHEPETYGRASLDAQAGGATRGGDAYDGERGASRFLLAGYGWYFTSVFLIATHCFSRMKDTVSNMQQALCEDVAAATRNLPDLIKYMKTD